VERTLEHRYLLSAVVTGTALVLGAVLATGSNNDLVAQVATTGQNGTAATARVNSGTEVSRVQRTRFRMDFRFQPWDKVLPWVAERAGVVLQSDVVPPGTFNFSDHREYTPTEAIEVINRVLSPKGYRLESHGRTLSVVELETKNRLSRGDVTGRNDRIRGVVSPHLGLRLDETLDLKSAPGLSAKVASWQFIEDLGADVAVFETVFWDPRDTVSLRNRIMNTSLVKGKAVLEIGTGSGLLSLCCLHAGASRVTATDVNRSAIDNAAYNAGLLGFDDRLDLRLVPLDDPGAFSVVGDSEKFDVIISNPPWENGQPTSIEKYALYDEGFQLMRSMFRGLNDHLTPDGKVLLAYGCVDAIKTTQRLAEEHGFEMNVLDDRNLDSLTEVFLPGMLLELSPRE
jgi:hypothetical protein